jgi:hypothetical protein
MKGSGTGGGRSIGILPVPPAAERHLIERKPNAVPTFRRSNEAFLEFLGVFLQLIW